jgi:hypothetical protein
VTARCALVAALALGDASCSGSDAQARPTSWKPFCDQLQQIKTTSETGGWHFPGDPQGLKTFDRWYKHVETVSPSADVAAWFEAGRTALQVGPYDAKFRAAIPAARKLKPVVSKRCGLELADVFKVGGY